MKSILKGNPVQWLRRKLRRKPKNQFEHSGQYWDDRYKTKRNSGSGSYGRLAVFKADILNAFVAENDLQTVIEFGCGDGNQLSLAAYPSYIGVDVSQTAVDLCARKFQQDDSKSFYLTGQAEPFTAQLSLSLDVIYHLVEDDVYEQYMRKLFDAALEYVVVYSSNYNDDFALGAKHVRHRKFTDWAARNAPDFELLKEISNPYPYDENDPTNTSLADFHFFKKTDNGKK